jgi:MFS family permease
MGMETKDNRPVSRLPAFRSRDYRIFWVGQFVSLIGTWMQNTVQPYLAYQLTGQPFMLGAVFFAQLLPTLLFTLPAGVYIERVDQRKVVIAMQLLMMVQAFALAAFTLLGVLTIWHIITLAFVLGTANSIEITARQSMLIQLVDKPALPNAIALNGTAFNLARVLGPIVAAPFLFFIGRAGEGWAFFTNGMSYLFVIVGLMRIRSTPRNEDTTPHRNAFDAFREGQDFIRQTSLVSILIALAAVFGFFGFTSAMQQVPVFARDILAQPSDTDAIVAARNSALVTATGIGALIAAVSLSLSSSMKSKGLLLSIGQIIFALSVIVFSQSRSFSLSLVCMALSGWGQVTALNNTNQLIQHIVPVNLRARVISTYLWALQGVAPFGSLFIGWLSQNFGASTAALVGGLVCLLAQIGVNVFSPELRNVRVE